MTKRTVVLLVATLLVLGGCSGKSASKAPGPGPAVATGEPCSTECCCRTEDGYYLHHVCSTEAECSASGGRCLAADTARCRH